MEKFIDKHDFGSENMNKINLLALNYYEQMIMVKTTKKKGGGYPKHLKNYIVNTSVFKSIKHNDSSKSFDTPPDSKSLNLNFKFAKLLLLGEFTDAIECLYDCEDLSRENLDLIRESWPLALELSKNIDFMELLKSYGVEIDDKEDQHALDTQDLQNKFEA